MSIKLKKIPRKLINLLIGYQDLTYCFAEKPSINDAKIFLAKNMQYTKRNLEVFVKYNDTRYKREKLNKKQFKEWYEFYFM